MNNIITFIKPLKRAVFSHKFFYSILLIIAFFLQANAQKNTKNKEYALYIVSHLHTRNLIDSIVDKNAVIFKDRVLKAMKLHHINQPEDKKYIFQKFAEEISFEKNRIWDKIVFIIEKKKRKELKNYIKLIKSNQEQKLKDKLNFNELISDFSYKEFKDFQNVNLTKILTSVLFKYKGIPIHLFLNNKELDSIPNFIQILVKYEEGEKNIIDKEKMQIIKPERQDHHKPKELIVKYQQHIFTFRPDNKSQNMPGRFKQMTDILSDYNFSKIDGWFIYITEKQNIITVEIENSNYQKQVKVLVNNGTNQQ